MAQHFDKSMKALQIAPKLALTSGRLSTTTTLAEVVLLYLLKVLDGQIQALVVTGEMVHLRVG